MALSSVCPAAFLLQTKTRFISSSTLKIAITRADSRSSASLASPKRHKEDLSEAAILEEQLISCPGKRRLGVSIIASVFLAAFPVRGSAHAEELELEQFTDSNEGFTLLRPSSYAKVEKSGATVLFEEVKAGSNNVGVVVNPVRLTSLKEFGSPEFVGDKIIQAERRKESTKSAEVIAAGERRGTGSLEVYEIEYKIDSTRGGMKRIFSAAFVASNKLYLLNISHSDRLDSPLNADVKMKLEEVLHSFDVAPVP